MVFRCIYFLMNHKKRKNYSDSFFEIFDKYPREYFIIAFFLIFFVAIIKEAFSYTVLNYDFYENLAYKQQVGEVDIPVARGTIYSSTGSGTVLATSVDLNDLAIDPQIEWDKSSLALYLTDIVYEELCFLQPQDECYSGVLKYLRKLQIEDFVNEEEYVKTLLLENITKRVSQTKMTSVLVAEWVANEQLTLLFSRNLQWVYINNNNVYVNPEEVVSEELVSGTISQILSMDRDQVLYMIRKRDLRYVPIINKLSLSLSDKIRLKIQEESQAIQQGVLQKQDSIGGFIIMTPHPQRIYPEWRVWAQLIGFLDNAADGQYGLEWEFNDLLQWSKWELISRKDIQWRIIDPISINRDTLTGQWVDIYTTIDRNMQRKVENILEAWVTRYWANRGTVVVMNPHDGWILAMANYPTYDPNEPGDVYELEKVNYLKYPNPATDLLWKTVFIEDNERGDSYYYDGKLVYLRPAEREEYDDYSLTKYKYKNDFGAWVYLNDAISGLYEPWSIMKSMTVAAGIDTWEITSGDFYNDTGKVTIDNFTIKNVSSKCLWYHTFAHALNYSCNVWMIRIVQRLGKALFHQYLTDFGFSDITDVSLEWEVFSKIIPYEKWSLAQLFTSSFGLWVSVTPLQMTAAYSVIANGWVYVKPRIIDSIEFSDGKTIQYKKEVQRRVIKESTSKIVSEMLVNGVENGVAGNALVEWYTIAGKTGTAQINYRWKYETGAASTNGSFVWFWPAEDPQFVVLVKLERPRNSNFGWETSAFIFADIAKELFDYYGIPKKVVK